MVILIDISIHTLFYYYLVWFGLCSNNPPWLGDLQTTIASPTILTKICTNSNMIWVPVRPSFLITNHQFQHVSPIGKQERPSLSVFSQCTKSCDRGLLHDRVLQEHLPLMPISRDWFNLGVECNDKVKYSFSSLALCYPWTLYLLWALCAEFFKQEYWIGDSAPFSRRIFPTKWTELFLHCSDSTSLSGESPEGHSETQIFFLQIYKHDFTSPT